MSLREEIESAINRNSAENGCDTPDFVLAEYLTDCLAAFDKAVNRREEWYGRKCGDGAAILGSPRTVGGLIEVSRDADGSPGEGTQGPG